MNIRDMKKRAGSFGLAALMSLSMAMPAFAASTEPPTKDIMGSYVAGDNAAVYSYSYHFGDMEFEYVGASSRKWNPQTHQYDEGTSSEGGWRAKTATSGDATVINYSNAPIKVSFGFEAAVDGMSFGASEQGFTIASAEDTTVDNAPSKTVKIGPAANCGVLIEGQTNVKLGTITLRVSAV